jgi:nitrogen fixation/metabolism regulation signal transduction histidine kinase
VVALVVCLVITRSVAGPIARLTHAADELGRGDLATRVDVKATGELGVLVNAFNGMAEKLATTTTPVEHLNAEVAERKQTEGKLAIAKGEAGVCQFPLALTAGLR